MLRRFALIASVALAAACSSSSGGDQGAAGVPAALAKYCTGTLKVDEKLMKPAGSLAWLGDGSLHAAAGTTFVLSPDFDKWAGYAFQADGTPTKIDVDFSTGLVEGTDFTSDCANAAALTDPFQGHQIVLSPSTIFPNKDLSGTPCKLQVGTELTSSSWSSGGFGPNDPATVSANEIQSQCGLATGYTVDLEYASLLLKP